MFTGPNIIKDGLVLALDAANPKSYPGSGTTWSDLSGNGNNGTLTNGPTFDSGNNGSIVFDGVNDYTSCSDILGGLTNYSAEFLFKADTNINGIEHWLGSQYPGTGRVIFDLWTNNKLRNFVGGTAIYGNTLIVTGLWYHVVFTRNSTGLASIYLNGIEDGSGTISTISVSSADFEIGGSTSLVRWMAGNIAMVKLYNKALTAQEVLQNYNATKGRYNL